MKQGYLLIILIFVSCNSTVNNTPVNQLSTDSVSQTATRSREKTNSLLDSIYAGTEVFKERAIDSFSFHHFSSNKEIVTARYSIVIGADTLSYMLELKDTAGEYSVANFQPTSNFLYLGSAFYFNKHKFRISDLQYENDKDSVGPVNFWYGRSLGILGKRYDLPDREVFLLRGINYECNGSNCMNFKVFIFQKNKKNNEILVNAIYLPGKYPYTFENILLFCTESDLTPTINIIKEAKNGEVVSDYLRLPLVLHRSGNHEN